MGTRRTTNPDWRANTTPTSLSSQWTQSTHKHRLTRTTGLNHPFCLGKAVEMRKIKSKLPPCRKRIVFRLNLLHHKCIRTCLNSSGIVVLETSPTQSAYPSSFRDLNKKLKPSSIIRRIRIILPSKERFVKVQSRPLIRYSKTMP